MVTDNMQPRLSVCIPVYNAGVLLKPAIESVLQQNFSEFELVIVDDGSSDSPTFTVREFDDNRIRFYHFDQNIGLAGNWNRCIDLSRGEYIAIFHQDDVMLPGNLQEKVDLLDSNSRAGFVYSNIETIDDQGRHLGGHYIVQPDEDKIIEGCNLYAMIAKTGNPVACSSVIVRSECYEVVGQYDTSLPYAVDLEMWMRIAAVYDVGYLARPLVAHRFHGAQEGARFQGSGYDYLDILRALDRAFARGLPSQCLDHERACYMRLVKHAVPMARWKLRQMKVKAALVYASVAIRAYSRTFRHRSSHTGEV